MSDNKLVSVMEKRKKYAPIPAVLNELGMRRRSPNLVPLVQMRKRIHHAGDASQPTLYKTLHKTQDTCMGPRETL